MARRDGGRRWRDTFGQNRLGPDPEEAARAAERLQTLMRQESDKENAVQELVRAWTNPGSHPSIHVAIQLRLAETPTDDRSPIPDEELDRVCPGWTRFDVPSGL